MTFVEGFYSFNLELTDTDRDRYARVRVKVPRHPHESFEHLFGRVLAWLHCYEPGQEFTRGLFEPKEPTIWRRDVIGALLLWVQLGCPDRQKLQRALRESAGEVRVYFYEPGQVEALCHMLRGSTTNWVEPVRFYHLDPELLVALAEYPVSSSSWQATFVDGQLYLVVDGREYASSVEPVDIWARYQESLLTGSAPEEG